MHNNLIILAAGASSRMKKAAISNDLSKEEIQQANERSKSLIGVGTNGRPLMDYLLYNARKAGYKNVYIIIGEKGELFKAYYSDTKEDKFQGLNIHFATQYIPHNRVKPYGTADALFQTVENYPELNTQYYTVCNSDNLYSVEALYALRATKSENAFISYSREALDFPLERISSFALVKLNDENSLVDIVEKPKSEEIENYRDVNGEFRVSMNAFKFNGKVMYKYLKDCPVHQVRKEKELPTAFLNMLIDYPNTAVGIPFSEHVPDLTAKEDISKVKEYLKKHFDEELNWKQVVEEY